MKTIYELYKELNEKVLKIEKKFFEKEKIKNIYDLKFKEYLKNIKNKKGII